ncbi:MAG: A24 family peptidase [Burkholderiales bacterium]|jgi:leader peptidase (prepilin peptidase)/N-methyltransferase|nr:A24 family peptidase [Burkholderiales bacterium]
MFFSPAIQLLDTLGPATLIGLAAVLGLLVGSFLNVVIYRLPKMMEADWQVQAAELRGEPVAERPPFNLMTPRSRCPHCGTPIAAWQNIPVISWLMLRGRCGHCGASIPVRYPLVEALTGLLAALAIAAFGPTAAGAGALLLSFALIALTFIDLDTQLLPDDITLPLLWLGLAFNLSGTFVPITEAVVGAMLGYGILWTIFWIFKLVTGKEGMGYGDFKLLAALGAWFGWKQIPSIILLASAVGATVGILLIVSRQHRREAPIPFGPYLAGAGLLALYFGKPLGAFFGIA